eukprot:1306806-Amphidinium_carterae.1
MEHEPADMTRKLAVLLEVLKAPSLDGKRNPSAFASELLKWEQTIRRYEEFASSSGTGPAQLDSDIKKAILMDRMPEELAMHCRVFVTDRTSYEELRDR